MPARHLVLRRGCRRRQPALAPQAALSEVAVAVQQPVVRDALAFLGSVIGARLLIRFFQLLEASGVVDQVG